MAVSPHFMVDALLGSVIVVAAWRARSLSGSGALAAAAVGMAAAAAGRPWVVLLIVYFVSASLISRVGRARKLQRTSGVVEKTGARDARQVLSNGLAFAMAAGAVVAGAGAPEYFLILSTGALAASASDTWATEIGTLVGHRPRSILSGRPLPIGASGGVTLPGSLASVAGAAFIALLGLIVGLPGRYFPWIAVGGVFGAFVDSLAGAAVQRRLWCDACDEATEMKVHSCGTPTRRVGGLPFIENDGVNLLATVAGSLATLLLIGLFA